MCEKYERSVREMIRASRDSGETMDDLLGRATSEFGADIELHSAFLNTFMRAMWSMIPVRARRDDTERPIAGASFLFPNVD